MKNKDKILEIISNHTTLDVKEIPVEAEFKNHLGLDSLEQLYLIMEFEDKFRISITDEEADTIKTVEDCIKLVESKLK